MCFNSIKSREVASQGNFFFINYTFKSCKQFYQIYTMHVDIGSTDEETEVILVIFALFPNKKKMFMNVNFCWLTHIPNFTPDTYIGFEIVTRYTIA